MAPSGSNHAFSGRHNRRLVFDLLRSAEGLSRSDLVGLTGLRPQTISNIVRVLMERGLIVEGGRSEGGRGAPPTYLHVNRDAGCALGLHLDRDGLTGVACDLMAEERARAAVAVAWNDPPAALDAVAALVAELAARCAGRPVWGLGLAMPTLQEAAFEPEIGPPGWQNWAGVLTADILEDACGLPVIVENDATAAALAERHAGAGLKDFVYVFVGHGVGAGILVDGLPFQGHWNNAGEIGLIGWPAELQAAGTGAATPFSLDELAALVGCREAELRAAGVLDRLYRDRNGALMTWLDLNGRRLRLLVSIVENLFDPETVFLGGALPEALRLSLVDRAFPLPPSVSARRRRERPRLQSTALGAAAPAIGAAMLPILGHGSPDFRRLSLARGRAGDVDPESRFDRVAGAPTEES